jgi:hypothetical protein
MAKSLCQSGKRRPTPDPDCGFFHKGEHKKIFDYAANVACDAHSYVLDFEVTAGNLNDSVVSQSLYRQLIISFPDIRKYVLDAGYKNPGGRAGDNPKRQNSHNALQMSHD